MVMLASLATPVLPLWSRWSRPPRGAAAIRDAQSRILARLVARLAPLPVGTRFGLDALRGRDLAGAFRAQVAVTQYADYAALIDRVADGESHVLL
nr:GH3 auxin-responsive promoter family protein [Planctomycetota bacterium]